MSAYHFIGIYNVALCRKLCRVHIYAVYWYSFHHGQNTGWNLNAGNLYFGPHILRLETRVLGSVIVGL